jgi:RNA ligase (TIGR02306 family)
MSTFAVERKTIETVQHHPNADRLDLCTVEGMAFQFITGRDQYKPGDEVVYFPVDSLLPEWLSERLGVQKPRIRTMKLRGCISQGLVCSPSQLPEIDGVEDITTRLEVVKYEPPEADGSELLPLPDGVGVYDIEGCDRYKSVADELMGEEVWISEKLEGSNYSIFVNEDGVKVCTRRFCVPEDYEFWKVTKELHIDLFARDLYAKLGPVTLRGEMIGPGIQGNIYGLKGKMVRFFDLMVNGQYVSVEEFQRHVSLRVPTLFVGKLADWLDGKTIQEASNGVSALADTAREGIVIKPLQEKWHPRVGRLVLKQRSPEYLCGCER